ncbi:uncharacterized protein LAESUDRAFT_653002, partial [Laetiporus sulphureus 93-53]
ELSINKLAKTYNGLCKQMYDLMKKCVVSCFAIAPMPIEANTLFKLDVDDDI